MSGGIPVVPNGGKIHCILSGNHRLEKLVLPNQPDDVFPYISLSLRQGGQGSKLSILTASVMARKERRTGFVVTFGGLLAVE